MDMTQYRELFLSETREHINNLNSQVVILEQEPSNRETIDSLFREAHSIKGMAATMGYDRTAQLSHHLEDMLDGFRSTGNVPASAVDYLLAGIDLLDGLLDDLQKDQPERSIDAFMSEKPADEPVSENQAEEASPVVDDQLRATENVPEEPDVFQILVTLADDTPASAARGILVLRELDKAGELISSTPDVAKLRDGAPCQTIQAWLRSSLFKEDIEESLLQISGVVKIHFVENRRKENRRGGDEAARTIRVRSDLLDQFVNLAGELITNRYVLNTAKSRRDWDELEQALSQTGRLINNLHHHVLQARLMPLENITGRLPRIVRDISRKTGKKVTLHLNGADVGIDRVVLEELTDPLVHLVRNAVDHGITDKGTVTISARREKDLVVIEVADDGKGMNPDHLRQKAVERGLLSSSQVASLSDRDALMLVCQPGFSTTEEITETSGRGVGMDVVKQSVGKLGGTLEIISAPAAGTRFQMHLPLSVAIIKVLLVSCAEHSLAIPITRVERTLDLPTREIMNSGAKKSFCLEEEEVPLYSLSEALGLPECEPAETTWIVLTAAKGCRVGLRVDSFLGHHEAFVKSLGFPLNLLTGLSGATIQGDGQVLFIVDPQSLLEDNPLFTEA